MIKILRKSLSRDKKERVHFVFMLSTNCNHQLTWIVSFLNVWRLSKYESLRRTHFLMQFKLQGFTKQITSILYFYTHFVNAYDLKKNLYWYFSYRIRDKMWKRSNITNRVHSLQRLVNRFFKPPIFSSI